VVEASGPTPPENSIAKRSWRDRSGYDPAKFILFSTLVPVVSAPAEWDLNHRLVGFYPAGIKTEFRRRLS
jgi:hypothetical protein